MQAHTKFIRKKYSNLRDLVRKSLLKRKYLLPVINVAPLGQLELGDGLIIDDICLPPYKGPSNHNDVNPLLGIARALRPNIILELGTAYGNTVANLCRMCPQAHIVTVDVPADMQTGIATTFKLGAEEIGWVYKHHGLSDQVTQLFQNTLHLNLNDYLAPKSVELVIIDACHDTDYVLNDFLKVQPYVRESGIVLLHDTHSSMKGHLRGSYRACMMLRRQGFDIRQIAGTWWGIWCPSDIDDRIAALRASIA